MTNRSFNASPTAGGYDGIDVHWDGVPSYHLPILLTARRSRFDGDTEALARHLSDDAAVGWADQGGAFLTSAPAMPVQTLTDTPGPAAHG